MTSYTTLLHVNAATDLHIDQQVHYWHKDTNSYRHGTVRSIPAPTPEYPLVDRVIVNREQVSPYAPGYGDMLLSTLRIEACSGCLHEPHTPGACQTDINEPCPHCGALTQTCRCATPSAIPHTEN